MRRRDLLVGAGAALTVLATKPAAAAIVLGCEFKDAEGLVLLKRERGARVLDEDGRFIAGLGRYYAPPVAVSELPRYLIQALVVSEDKNFDKHGGIDFTAIARAVTSNCMALAQAVWSSDIDFKFQGTGSTITQQTLKNVCFRDDHVILRKFKEFLAAGQLEDVLSKPEILYVYLNVIFFGGRTYGIEAAARVYFGKSARDLTELEAAVLVQLINAPNDYNPHTDPKLALARAGRLLDRMVKKNYLTRSAAARARRQGLRLAAAQRGLPGYYKRVDVGWFAGWARQQAERLVPTGNVVTTVVTTLRPKLQQITARHLRAAFEQHARRLRFDQGAAVVMALNGDVLAMVGGRDFRASQWDCATRARRQPGSAFKLFVYLAALERGLGPTAEVLDAPLQLEHKTIRNIDVKEEYRGVIPLREAFACSSNPAAVRLAMGHVPAIAEVARRLGISAPLGREAGLALGDKGVSLLELTAAYATIANRGLLAVPNGILEIRDNLNKPIWRRGSVAAARRVVQARHAEDMRDMLAQVVREGTGRRADPGYFAAGKTGTSNQYRDAWFVGFTERFVAGVWLGNEMNTPMNKVTGGGLPAEIWRAIMRDATG